MKNIVIALIGMLGLASCSDEVKFRTIVNEDGSIEKTITLTTSDSISKSHHYLGITDSLAWEYKRIRNVKIDSSSLLSSLKKVEEISSIPINKDGKDSTVVHERISYDHQFYKKFFNTDTFNNVLQKQKSNHLSISASFNKRFRWFYTYFDYAETFGPINNFDYPIN
ncbi:MAG: hypothetical protein MUF68_09685, partial [Cyclobacteriaceae bacterium]|nr:hypothetical protein [Cyclobacteriaceae bacterium]